MTCFASGATVPYGAHAQLNPSISRSPQLRQPLRSLPSGPCPLRHSAKLGEYGIIVDDDGGHLRVTVWHRSPLGVGAWGRLCRGS
jgi:hypothetical protein